MSSGFYGSIDGAELITEEVRAARRALTTGLTALRVSLNDMMAGAVRGEGGAQHIRTRQGNDAATRHQPAGTKPVGGRVSGRPAMPNQRAPGAPAEGDTVVLPRPAEKTGTGDGGDRTPTGHPARPDRGDPAHEVWILVERAQQGDSAAFGLIYDRYVDTVFRFVYFRVGNRPLAEDLTSDTFLRALKRISSFTWQGRDLGAWLITIARNLVADHVKSGRYRLEVTTGDVLDADREDRGPEGSPETAVVDHITNVALLTAVKQLNPEQQECIVLRFLQGFSVAETAQTMGKNEGAIKALQYRAVRALARLLPEGFQP
jgi:RNA polymerase sigma-70 factor, ECF subfamily